jgi:glycosyltransferase involved in cell wall biosynthesis
MRLLMYRAMSKSDYYDYYTARIQETARAWEDYGIPTQLIIINNNFCKHFSRTLFDLLRLAWITRLDARRLLLTGLEYALLCRTLVSEAKKSLRAEMRVNAPEVLEVHDIFTGRASSELGLPYVATLAPVEPWLGNGADIISSYLKDCEAITVSGATRVFVQTESEARLLSKRHRIAAERFIISPRWVDLQKFPPGSHCGRTEPPYFAVMHNWQHSNQGLICTLEALSSIRDLNIDLWIIGIPQFRVVLERLIREMDLITRVRLREFRNRLEVVPVLQDAAGVIWSLAQSETGDSGHAVTVQEAIALGVPTITSKSDSWQSPVRDGQTGYVFETGDTHTLAVHLRSIIQGVGTIVPDMAGCAIENVTQEHSFELWAQLRLHIFNSIGHSI